MATGTLLPIPRLGIVTSAGCLLHVYVAGTSTLATTYSDSGLTIANTNPVIADADGLFGPIYVGIGSFKLVLQDAAGNTILTQDQVPSFGQLVAGTSIVDTCNGRLTLQSGVPVSTDETLSAATVVYFSPYKGNRIALYDGSAWGIYTFNELSINLGSDTASKNYDVFAYLNAGAVAIERLVWTSDSARATTLAFQDGIYVKSGDPTRRYLGTYRTTGSAGQTADIPAQRFVWNYYNRVRRLLRRFESTDSWTYTVATFRQANNASANKVEIVVGIGEAQVEVQVRANAVNGVGANVAVAVAEDSLTTAVVGSIMQNSYSNTANLFATPSASATRQPSAGYHYYAWLEWSGVAGTTTWYGDNGTTTVQTGMVGTVEG